MTECSIFFANSVGITDVTSVSRRTESDASPRSRLRSLADASVSSVKRLGFDLGFGQRFYAVGWAAGTASGL